MSSFKIVGVIGKRREPRVVDSLLAACEALAALGCEVLVDADSAELDPRLAALACPRDELVRRAQLAVVVGGDGTLLDAGRSFAPTGIPILGVNQGRLGFLVDVRPEEIAEALASLMRGEFRTEERLLLEARVCRPDGTVGPPLLAVNDVVLRNQASIRMLEFETWLANDRDCEFISQHRADGIIIATPTGSTAYSLSSGGPVLHPALEAVTLVPICPHTLSDRPIVVPASRTIRIVVGRGASGAMVTCDGQIVAPLDGGDAVEIVRSQQVLRLVHPNRYSYFELLRDKLHWGRHPGGLADSP
jgi:NAD+ kinase